MGSLGNNGNSLLDDESLTNTNDSQLSHGLRMVSEMGELRLQACNSMLFAVGKLTIMLLNLSERTKLQ